MTQSDGVEVERFNATSGRVTGWLTVVVAVLVVGLGVVYVDEGFPVWVIASALLVGVLAWAAMLRPALWVRGEHLVMRNMLETITIRLDAVEEMAVRQVLAVRADDRRWVSTVVGRSWRRTMRPGRSKPAEPGGRPETTVRYVDFVEDRLRELVGDARTATGVRPGSPEQLALPDAVRRERAWVPIALVAVSALALVVSLLV